MTMTVREEPSALREPCEVEVATLAADPLRASIRVTGRLDARSAALLSSVISTHVGAGRRYLRIDLGAAHLDHAVIDMLVAAHRDLRAAGGMLVFENAGPLLVDAVRSATLFVTNR